MDLALALARRLVLSITLLLAFSALANADDIRWQPTVSPGLWSNPNNWMPATVPGSGTNVLVTSGGPTVDINVEIGSLSLQGRSSVGTQVQGAPHNFTVTGTTTLTPPTPPGFGDGGHVDTNGGSTMSLGTLTNFSNGQLTGSYEVDDIDYLTNRTPCVIQFRSANVIDNRGEIYLLGDDAYIRDQDSGLDAFRNLAVNNGYYQIEDAPPQSTSGSLTNNGNFLVYDSFSPPRTVYTVPASLTNNSDGYLEVYGNAQIIVKANLVNHGTGSYGAIYVNNNTSAVAGEALLRVEKDLMNDGKIVVRGVSGHPARLEVLGAMTNTGDLTLDGVGDLQVGGSLTMGSGHVTMTGNTGFETFIMTAKRIDQAAGVEWGARGTVFADLVGRGILAPGASPGRLTLNGDITWLDPAELRIEIGGTAPGTQYDQVVQQTQAGGSGVKLGGTLSVTFVNGLSSVQNSDAFAIVTSDRPITGQFSNVPSGGQVPTTDGSGSFRVDYSGTNSVTLSQFQAAIPPVITSIPVNGVPSSAVTILGSGFFGTTDVKFNGTSASSFSVVSDNQLSTTVPVLAGTGPITVVTNHGNATSSTNFTVLPDSDADGMSDDYEQLYFGGTTAGQPNDDSDGDGVTNVDEFRAGTNPVDANSVMRVKQIRRQGNDIIIVFPSASDKRYQLQASATPNFAFPIRLTTLSAGAADPARQVTDASAAADLVRFYRVVVLP